MQKNFTNENFEDFLKQNADQLKLTPSLKTWKGIEKRLSKGRRWSTIIASAFLLSASLFGYLATDTTRSIFKLKQPVTADNTESTSSEEKGGKVIPITKNRTASSNKPIATTKDNGYNNTSGVIDNSELGLLFNNEFNETSSILNNEINTTSINAAPVNSISQLTDAGIEPIDIKKEKSNLLSIQNISKAVKAAAKKRKTELEFFFTPTISYRKLSENKSYLRSLPNNGFTFASAYTDVNNLVTHKPHMGLEFGFAYKYRVAKAVKIRGGLQFNINGYEIKAFDNTPELATISLNNRTSVRSVNTISTYRNFNGGRTDWLKNSYFQVSAPVGVEVKLLGSDKTHFGVSTSVQPTYLLGEKAYLISNDYKNYSEVPWLIRRWNVNTSLETYVGYATGKLKWQVGPQIRYQLLSSFVSTYPVKENLIDVGLKVAVSLNNK
ncbi:MAG TPA: hypothetical protein VM888_04420 [Chitinophagaceae bacterium]|nr:hypothetical protein [Chitinophagaceae bacterium]